MNKQKLQVSLKAVLVLTLIVAAYLAGRTPWERQSRQSAAMFAATEQGRVEAILYANVWREIALECRDDIRESGRKWDIESVERFGGGGSFVGSRNDDRIRPRAKRWKIIHSDDPVQYKTQIQTLGIEIVCVWDDPPRIMKWAPDAGDFEPVDADEGIEQQLIMAGERQEFALLPDHVFDNEPRYVLRAIPQDVEMALAVAEYRHCEKSGVSIQDVVTTSFALIPKGDKFEVAVVSQTHKETE